MAARLKARWSREEIERAAARTGVPVRFDPEPDVMEPSTHDGWLVSGGLYRAAAADEDGLYDLAATDHDLYYIEQDCIYDGLLGTAEDARQAMARLEVLWTALEEAEGNPRS